MATQRLSDAQVKSRFKRLLHRMNARERAALEGFLLINNKEKVVELVSLMCHKYGVTDA